MELGTASTIHTLARSPNRIEIKVPFESTLGSQYSNQSVGVPSIITKEPSSPCRFGSGYHLLRQAASYHYFLPTSPARFTH